MDIYKAREILEDASAVTEDREAALRLIMRENERGERADIHLVNDIVAVTRLINTSRRALNDSAFDALEDLLDKSNARQALKIYATSISVAIQMRFLEVVDTCFVVFTTVNTIANHFADDVRRLTYSDDDDVREKAKAIRRKMELERKRNEKPQGNISVGGNVGPGSVVGTGSVTAFNISRNGIED